MTTAPTAEPAKMPEERIKQAINTCEDERDDYKDDGLRLHKDKCDLIDEVFALKWTTEQLRGEVERIRAIALKDPVVRLNNICAALEEHKAESPYDQASWELADADNKQLRARVKVLEAALKRISEMSVRPNCVCGITTGTAAIKHCADEALKEPK